MKSVLASMILPVAFAMVMACDVAQVQQCTSTMMERLQNAVSDPSLLTTVCQYLRVWLECIRPAIRGCQGDFSTAKNLLNNLNRSPYNCSINIHGIFPIDNGNEELSTWTPDLSNFRTDILASDTTCDAQKIKKCNQEMLSRIQNQNVCKVVRTWTSCVKRVFANCHVDSTTLNKLNKQLDYFNKAPYNCDVQHISGGSGVPAVSLICLVVASILALMFN